MKICYTIQLTCYFKHLNHYNKPKKYTLVNDDYRINCYSYNK